MNIYKVYKHYSEIVVRFLFKYLNNSFRVMVWKKMGVKMGANCRISCMSFSPESYLIELGDHVVIAENTFLITHEGGICIFHRDHPKLDSFGKIKIGDNTFIGMNCLILPNTTIGKNCVVGAGSVVRGDIPDNSVVYGNPARVVMKTSAYKMLIYNHRGTYEYKGLSDTEKKRTLLERLA